ncbi:MAG: hypothetical protein EA379_01590, partial [Phycisphaerales bacterium]
PAGPVAPTGKTIGEVEPRTAVNAQNTPGDVNSVFRITEPGSYYLTGNISGQPGRHGITIASGNVTLDLSGFTMTGGSGSLNGIDMPSFQVGVVIRNGTVRGWGQSGVLAAIDNGAVQNIYASNNNSWGIRVTDGSFGATVTDCGAFSNGLPAEPAGGIFASGAVVISNCRATHNRGVGFSVETSASVSNSVARSNTSHGFVAVRSMLSNITSTNNSGEGVRLSVSSLLESSVVSANTGAGVNSQGNSIIRHNVISNNGLSGGAPGIVLPVGNNRVEGNEVRSNGGIGVHAITGGNIIIGNTARGNGTNWSIAAGNVCLVVNATTGAAFTGNAGGLSPGTTNPYANFTY